MWNVVFRPEARRDIIKATRWYKNENHLLGERFADAVDDAVDTVLDNPHLYPIVQLNTRRALVSGFPYGLYYWISDDAIVITACTHSSRHPRHWRAE